VAHMGVKSNMYRILVAKHGEKRTLWRHKNRFRIILKESLKIYNGMVLTGFYWLRIGTSVKLFWTQQWSFGFLERKGSSWLAEELLAAQERLLCGINYLVGKLPPFLVSQSARQSEWTAWFVSQDKMRSLLIWCSLITLQLCMVMCCAKIFSPGRMWYYHVTTSQSGCGNLTTPLCIVPHVFGTDHINLEHWCKIMMYRGTGSKV
jgi:hypothetical protein